MIGRIFGIIMLIGFLLGFSLPARASNSVIDTFDDESKIATKTNLNVDTGAGQVLLDSDCPSGHTDNGDGTCTATFYPDADPESTTVDGYVQWDNLSTSWIIIHDVGNGTGASSSDTDGIKAVVISSGYPDEFYTLRRGFMLFDTSSLPDEATLNAATLSIYGSYKNNNWTTFTPAVNIYSSNPASNTNLTIADYDQVGNTAFCDTNIEFSDWSTAGYNDFEFNADGLAAISDTDISKFSFREATQDAPDIQPYWQTWREVKIEGYSAEQGDGYKPKLEVTYNTVYEELGELWSTNLLSGQAGTNIIDSFDYNASLIPTGASLKVQFSLDNSNWYDSSGLLNGWETLLEGDNSIDLSSLGWSGGNFYYKTEFISDVSSGTPILDEISLNYESIPEPASLLLLGFGVFGVAIFKRRVG